MNNTVDSIAKSDEINEIFYLNVSNIQLNSTYNERINYLYSHNNKLLYMYIPL